MGTLLPLPKPDDYCGAHQPPRPPSLPTSTGHFVLLLLLLINRSINFKGCRKQVFNVYENRLQTYCQQHLSNYVFFFVNMQIRTEVLREDLQLWCEGSWIEIFTPEELAFC